MIKKSRMFVVALLIIIPIASYLISISDRDLSDSRYEKILQMIVISPDAVVIRQGGVEITQDFLNIYQDAIEHENYAEAI